MKPVLLVAAAVVVALGVACAVVGRVQADVEAADRWWPAGAR